VTGKNGRILFDRPKPTVGCSANGIIIIIIIILFLITVRRLSIVRGSANQYLSDGGNNKFLLYFTRKISCRHTYLETAESVSRVTIRNVTGYFIWQHAYSTRLRH
jgi:hypothetical protein